MKKKYVFAIVFGLWWLIYSLVLHPGSWPFAIIIALFGYFIGSPLDDVKISTPSSRRSESFLRFMIVAGFINAYILLGLMLSLGFGAHVLVFGISLFAIIGWDILAGLVSLAIYVWATSNKEKFPKAELFISIILFIILCLPLVICLIEA